MQLPVQLRGVLLAAMLALTTAHRHARGQDRDAPASPLWPSLQALAINVEIFNPIATEDLLRYTHMLALSPAQVQYLQAHYDDQYRSAIRQIEAKHGPDLIKMGEQFVQGIADKPEFGVFYTEFREKEEALCTAVERADAAFFTQVELALSEPQRELMPRVRLHRQRQQTIPRFAVRRARIDLSDMLERSNLPPNVRLAADQMLYEYERAYTPTFARADRVRRHNRAPIDRWATEIQFDENGQPRDHSSPEAQRIVGVLQERREAARDEQTQAQLRVAAINDDFAPKIADALPPEAGRDFRIAYLSRAYERVYPDPTDPMVTYESLLAMEGFPDELEPLFQAHWATYRRGYDQVCANMVRISQAWQERYARTSSPNGADEHDAAMKELQRERADANERFVALLRTLTPETLRAASAPAFAKWDALARRHGTAELRPMPRGGDPR